MKVIRGLQPADDAFKGIIRQLELRTIPLHKITLKVSLYMLSNQAVDAFSESDPTKSKKGGNLGVLAERMLMVLTSNNYPQILFECPLLHAYGTIEQEYLDLRKLAHQIDTEGKGEWDINLKSMTIPLTDEIFTTSRRSEVESMASCRLAQRVSEQLKMLALYPQLL